MRWARADKRYGWCAAWANEQGTVSAEFAVVLPAVLVVLGLVVGGVMLSAQRLTLVSMSGEIARAEARDDADASEAVISHLGARVDIERDRETSLHCVTLTSHPAQGLLSRIGISARSCAVTIGAEP